MKTVPFLNIRKDLFFLVSWNCNLDLCDSWVEIEVNFTNCFLQMMYVVKIVNSANYLYRFSFINIKLSGEDDNVEMNL